MAEKVTSFSSVSDSKNIKGILKKLKLIAYVNIIQINARKDIQYASSKA